MREFWGDRWPEVQAVLAKKGQDPTAIPEEPLPDWSTVADEVRRTLFKVAEPRKEGMRHSFLKDVEPITRRDLHSRFGIPENDLDRYDLVQVNAVAAEEADKVRNSFEIYVSGLNAAMQVAFSNGWYSKGPFITIPIGLRQGSNISSCGGIYKGWAITCGITREDFPELVDLQHDIGEVKQARYQAIAAYLANTGSPKQR